MTGVIDGPYGMKVYSIENPSNPGQWQYYRHDHFTNKWLHIQHADYLRLLGKDPEPVIVEKIVEKIVEPEVPPIPEPPTWDPDLNWDEL